MKPPLTYYGGKQLMCEIIDELVPAGLEKMVYCEPYFGGGAYYFYKKPSRIEAINDYNENLITFYEVTQDPYEFTLLKKMIDKTLYAEKYHMRARLIYNDIVPSDRIEKAWAVWIMTNFSFSGSPSGGWKWSNGTSGGGDVGVYFYNKKTNFTTTLQDRLRHTAISCRNAIDIIKQRDSKDTFFYLDPPYIGANQKHYSGFTIEKFTELLELISNFKSKFMLSNYNNRILSKFIKENNWIKHEFKMAMRVAHLGTRETNAKKKKDKIEVLILNYEPDKKSNQQEIWH